MVEDSPIVADLISLALTETGWDVVGPFGRVREAMAMARGEALDGALLDVQLAAEDSFPIAEILHQRTIPFMFLTGYGDETIPLVYRESPCLKKPFDLDEMLACAAVMFGRTPTPTAQG